MIDFCNANCTQIASVCELTEGQTVAQKLAEQCKNVIKLVFRCNFANKKVDYILNFATLSEKEDWVESFNSLELKSTQPLPETIDLNR